MFYYEVLTRLHSYHGSDYLTYNSEQQLAAGQVVRVAVNARPALGIIMAKTSEPPFKTKPINTAVELAPLPDKTLQLITWLKAYYPAPLGLLAQLFLPAGLPQKIVQSAPKFSNPKKLALPPLTLDQSRALTAIKSRPGGTTLLHGDTATGKTRIYIELTNQALAAQKSVLLLTPEISLTPQLLAAVERGTGSRVIVLHSNLTDAERRAVWMEILQSTMPLVVIGPRSALFAPFKNLGLIVVDEFHEPAFKQEQSPYYQAVRVASQLARMHGCQLVLGSATPPVAEYYLAEAKNAPILRLTELAAGRPGKLDLPKEKETVPVEISWSGDKEALSGSSKSSVHVVDLRDKSLLTRDYHLSNLLLDTIQTALDKGEQSLIFLNRRGTARLVMCQSCGWQALCPRCDLPLTYHGDDHKMLCHTCGYQASAPTKCPDCGSNELLFKSIGTKSLTDKLSRLFPKAKVQRFDSDSTKDERFEQHYTAVKSGKVDIIVGTQLLAKGLDLPRLSVVGVVLADSSLYIPDYTAEERTYQLLHQVIGRVGRGHRDGTAIIQTYRPEGPAIQSVLGKDWDTFYKEQLKERETFIFPPFCFLMKLSIKRASRAGAQKAAETLLVKLQQLRKPIQIIGPSPAFHEKISAKYQWQLIIKSRARRELTELITHLPSGWIYDLDPSNLL